MDATKGQREKFVRAGKTILWVDIGGVEYYVPKYIVALDQHMPTTSSLFEADPSPPMSSRVPSVIATCWPRWPPSPTPGRSSSGT